MGFLVIVLALALGLGWGVTFLTTGFEAKGFLAAVLGAGFLVDIFNP